jgi:hypothetical protein
LRQTRKVSKRANLFRFAPKPELRRSAHFFVAAVLKEVAIARLLGGRIETEHPLGAGALDLPALS